MEQVLIELPWLGLRFKALQIQRVVTTILGEVELFNEKTEEAVDFDETTFVELSTQSHGTEIITLFKRPFIDEDFIYALHSKFDVVLGLVCVAQIGYRIDSLDELEEYMNVDVTNIPPDPA